MCFGGRGGTSNTDGNRSRDCWSKREVSKIWWMLDPASEEASSIDGKHLLSYGRWGTTGTGSDVDKCWYSDDRCNCRIFLASASVMGSKYDAGAQPRTPFNSHNHHPLECFSAQNKTSPSWKLSFLASVEVKDSKARWNSETGTGCPGGSCCCWLMVKSLTSTFGGGSSTMFSISGGGKWNCRSSDDWAGAARSVRAPT